MYVPEPPLRTPAGDRSETADAKSTPTAKGGASSSHCSIQPAPPMLQPACRRALRPCVPPFLAASLLPLPLAERCARPVLCRMAQAWLGDAGGAKPRFDALLASASHGHLHRVGAVRQPHLQRLGSVAKQGPSTTPQSPCFMSVDLPKLLRKPRPAPSFMSHQVPEQPCGRGEEQVSAWLQAHTLGLVLVQCPSAFEQWAWLGLWTLATMLVPAHLPTCSL